MKTQFLSILLVLGFVLLIGCSHNDPSSQEIALNGTWNLKNVHGGLGSVNIDYSRGDVRWSFNEADSTLTVINNNGNDNSFMLHNGTYEYNIEQNDEFQILFVDSDYRMVIFSMDKTLVISDDMNDGFTAEFNR